MAGGQMRYGKKQMNEEWVKKEGEFLSASKKRFSA